MDIVTIDFEASCLPRHGRSFPIELGIADGAIARSWLIRPHADWAGWDWTQEAQSLHGISRSTLRRIGRPAREVYADLVAVVAGRRLVADSLVDQYWLDRLAEAAGEPCVLRIEHASTVLEEYGICRARVAHVCAMLGDGGLERHRAGADALWLSRLLRQLLPAEAYAAVAA